MAFLYLFDFYVLLLALAIEAAIGYPAWLYRAVRHPVVWMGWLIDWLDRRLNRDNLGDTARRIWGAVSLGLLLVVSGCVAVALFWLCRWVPFGWLVQAVIVAVFLAQHSLFSHVAAVAEALKTSGLAAGQKAVAHIVGRDTQSLDEAGVCRAAIESLAENFSDGVVGPVFWFVALGLPGMVLYKAINTADSMIGHLTPRHRAFGWAAARLDDLVNWPASRLSALLLVLAALIMPGASAAGSWRTLWRDAKRHRSPNAGWPEAATAGALDLRLAGPRSYDGKRVEEAWLGNGATDAEPSDIRRALRLYLAACAALWLLVGIFALASSAFTA